MERVGEMERGERQIEGVKRDKRRERDRERDGENWKERKREGEAQRAESGANIISTVSII